MKAKEIIDTLVHQLLTRRMAITAAGGLAAGGLAMALTGCAHYFEAHGLSGRVGLQLYSLRDQFGKDVPGTMDQIHNWDIKYVELAGTYGQTPEDFNQQLLAHHLDAVSGHFSFDEWAKDPEAVLRQAKVFGLRYVGCAWIPHEGPFDEAACRKAIAVFNRAGELAAAQNMTFFYHTHGYEFEPFADGTLFDLLVRQTDMQNVKFEMDIFWVAHAGQDCAKLLEKYPERWELMHLKDMRKGTPNGMLNGSSDTRNDVILGTGELDLPGILHAAEQDKVKYYFIEDESPDSVQQIPLSLKYLADFQ
jgi:sugar phosphate isomerase/epimerase